MNKVSVIIPMYNACSTIIDCIESVINQNYSYYEVIIIDDGSTDESYKIVEDYIQQKKLNHKIILVKQKNSGPSKARNKGIQLSTGKYIAFLDSDDIWMHNKLIKQISIMENDSDIKLSGTSVKGKLIKDKRNIIEITFKKLLYRNYFMTPTVIVKKEVLDLVGGFDEKKKYSEDYDLWLKIASENKVVLLNEELCICGGGKPTFGYSGLSSNLKQMEYGELENYYNLLRNNKINIIRFIRVCIFSYIKYIRRIIITKIRRNR